VITGTLLTVGRSAEATRPVAQEGEPQRRVTPRHSAPARWAGAGISCVHTARPPLRGSWGWIDEPIANSRNGHLWAPERRPADKDGSAIRQSAPAGAHEAL